MTTPYKAPASFRRTASLTIERSGLLKLVEAFLDPLTIIFSLFAVELYQQSELTPPYLILALLIFAISFPGDAQLNMSIMSKIRHIYFEWAVKVGLLAFFGYASRYLEFFDSDVLLTWLWLAPTAQVGAHVLVRQLAPAILKIQGETRLAVVAGLNEQSAELASRIKDDRYSDINIVGFFDDRTKVRLERPNECRVLGNLYDLPRFVNENRVPLIYLSLPMSTQPRILTLLDKLRDTTASIYFVPDIFVTDLIQGRLSTAAGLPVVAVCESPFTGFNGVIKRVSDILLSLLILCLISPLMLFISMGVKFSSPGPIIFKQRRYGLDGKEIIVYKFRSMTVCDDGEKIRQAQKFDSRITPFGAFLRKTSLDELPQFINVLQGRMSIVGPRPHAVAHNEEYRKLIKGYMVRHKVKPGITGWAQVNGYRGETEVLEKMKKRIDYDLEYLRNWSLKLDLYIIVKTVLVVLRDRHAY
ncbi:MAG TPA: undecaprenyl-phosphate glucose phosphotransferase [Gallionella sp.]|nr:undecaprenyl-phosphate glucose phosphotransferase [Gallionella sp.]